MSSMAEVSLLMFRQPIRRITDPNIVYSFIQRSCDGSMREICVATRMAAQEGIDTLIAYENISGPRGSGSRLMGRVLR